jgi:glycosyltransferase involved in cell wall biosynthesis/SAM-dependent methyltransferase
MGIGVTEPMAQPASERFAFGDNWRRFLAHLTPERIAGAEESLRKMLGCDSLEGQRFLDIGSGSGLFSLAARRLGANVVSFDFDADSVACTRHVRDRYYPDDPRWRIEQGSVLDREFLAGLGVFEIVYAWGVLHHTGSMWQALENTMQLLTADGRLVVALYNDQGWISKYWHWVKRRYHKGGPSRLAMLGLHVPYLVGARRLVRRLSGRERLDRGMSYWYDMRDWLGGLPFEVVSRERVTIFMAQRGLELEKLVSCGNRHGCNEFVFKRSQPHELAPPSGRILFLARALGFGGAERQLALLAQGLHSAGYDVEVAALYGGGPFEDELREAGVPVHVLGKRGRWDVFGFSRALLRLVRDRRPAIIHSYLVIPNIVASALRAFGVRSRVVWGIRASSVEWPRYEWSFRASFELSRAASRFAHLIISNSEAGKRFHCGHGYPANRTVVVPNGIDARRFAPGPERRAATRARWGIDGDAPVVAIVGRLDPMKAHDAFLRVAALIKARRPDTRFAIIGDGPADYAARLREYAARLGVQNEVVWISSHTDVHAAYAAIDVLASLSAWGEGFPNVVAEAMATEVPCVVTDCGDSALVVGDTGRIVAIGDDDGAAAAILSILEQPPEARVMIGRAARQRIVNNFSIERLVSNTAAALRPLLAAS